MLIRLSQSIPKFNLYALLASLFFGLCFATGVANGQAIESDVVEPVVEPVVETVAPVGDIANDNSVSTEKPVVATRMSQPPAASPEVASATQLLKTIFGLIVVIVIIFGLAWLVKRYGNFSVSGQGQLKLVAGLNVGQKERVVIVQVGDTQLLLGVAPGRVEKLHEISPSDHVIINDSEKTNGAFALRLKQAMKGRES